MKKFIKFILTVAMTASFMTAALASTAHYGAPKKTAAGKLGDGISGYVTLTNTLPQSFTVYAVFKNSQQPATLPIYPAGDPRSVIYYDIVYTDTIVCVSLNPSSQPTCVTGGPYEHPTQLFIRYGSSANGAPMVTKG